jgi:WD40 repeat protein
MPPTPTHRCSRTGALLHTLAGHTSDVHVLQCHPTEKRLVMTAGYDGKINVWDIERGRLQQSYAPSLGRPRAMLRVVGRLRQGANPKQTLACRTLKETNWKTMDTAEAVCGGRKQRFIVHRDARKADAGAR